MAKFRILSLDGGGIRGAFSASFLAELERKVGHPIGQYFDLIVGTSTGGIIATALALGESAERIERMYRDRGREIFTRQPRDPSAAGGWLLRLLAKIFRSAIDKRLVQHGLDLDHVLQAKYDSEQLRA